MSKYETLNVNPQAKATITKLAKKFDFSIVDFVENMAIYFDTTGVNPKDLAILSPAEELKKFRDTIISFMRKQEKDFILPVFSRVDAVAVRLIQYIDEEAPKRGDVAGQNKVKSLALSGEISTAEKKGSLVSEAVKNDVNSEEYKDLQERLNKSELKLKTTREYLENILSHTENRATGLERKPVIELPMGDINEYRKYLKTL